MHCTNYNETPLHHALHFTAPHPHNFTALHPKYYTALHCIELTTLHDQYSTALYSLHCTATTLLHSLHCSCTTQLSYIALQQLHCTPTGPLNFTALYSLHCITITLRCTATRLLHCISLHGIHYTAPLYSTAMYSLQFTTTTPLQFITPPYSSATQRNSSLYQHCMPLHFTELCSAIHGTVFHCISPVLHFTARYTLPGTSLDGAVQHNALYFTTFHKHCTSLHGALQRYTLH